MTKSPQNEREFFIALEDLIRAFAEDRNVEIPEQKGFSKSFIEDFSEETIDDESEELTSATSEEKHSNSMILDIKFSSFVSELEKTSFSHHIIPYDEITKSVFENTHEEDLYEFTKELRERGSKHFSSNTSAAESKEKALVEDPEKMYFKILRHINLALVQKYSFMSIQIKDVDKLKREHQKLSKDYKELKASAESQYRNMLTQFITILGIFAAILMGAFGAIQGFANLFDNAHELSLDTILIISSIGASSVLLILFFLLNGIAKLTGKNLSSVKNEDEESILLKHPSLTISHGILILIALIGFSIKLSNMEISFSWSGLWWLMPVLWVVYLFFAFSTKRLLPSFSKYTDKNDLPSTPIPKTIQELIPKKPKDTPSN